MSTESADFHPLPYKYRTVAGLAELYLKACAIGAPCGDLAVALAEAVLDDTAVRLALDVLDGGDHMHARATDLAELVIREALPAKERATS